MVKKNWRRDTRAVSRAVMAGGVVAILAVGAIVGYLMLGGGGPGGSTVSSMAVGDYLKFVDETHGGSLLVDTYWINVTAVTSTSYTVQVAHYQRGEFGNDYLYSKTNQTVDKDKVMSIVGVLSSSLLGTDQGTMSLETAFGSRNVRHYQHSYGGQVDDYFIGTSSGLLYKHSFSLGSETGEMVLVASNLSWA